MFVLCTIIFQSNWMDSRTKLIALKKLDNLVARAAVPNEFYDDKKLNEYYQNFEVHSESYLRSHLSSVFFHQSYHLKLLSKPVNRTDWREHIHPLNAIAYYIPQKNIIGNRLTRLKIRLIWLELLLKQYYTLSRNTWANSTRRILLK